MLLSKQYLPTKVYTFLVFLTFNLLLFAVPFISSEYAFIFYCFLISLICVSFFVFSIDNYLEIISTVALIFFIQRLYSDLGLLALISGCSFVFLLVIIRCLVNYSEHWAHMILKLPIYLFAAYAFISIFIGQIPLQGIRIYTINILLGLSIYYVTHFICFDKKSIFYLTLFMIMFLFVNALYAILDHLQTGSRATSFFINTPTYSGHFFVQGIAISTGLLFAKLRANIRYFLMLAIIVLIVATFLTITRAAWLAFIFLGFLVIFFSPIPQKYKFYGTIITLVTATLILLFFSSNQLISLLQTRVQEDVSNASQNMGSIAFRIILWKSALEIFLQNPIIGIGFDNFVIINQSTSLFPILKALGGEKLYVHNVYLQLLAELGLIGFGLFLFLLLQTFKKFKSIKLRLMGHSQNYIFLGYGGAFLLWLFMALTEAALYTPVTSAFFFFYLGILSGFNKVLLFEERGGEIANRN